MTNSEALECFESDCETCQFKGHDCKSCRTKAAISALRAQDAKDMNVPANDPCEWCSYFEEESKSFYFSEYGDDKQNYKFCPMCGRKLPQ